MKTWTSMEKFTAIEMSRAGASAGEIGRKLSRSRKAVEEWFKRQREAGYSYRLGRVREAVLPDDTPRIPTFVITDLARRLSIVPTFDNLMTGTPLPTCSCLDRPPGLYYAR